MNLIIINDTKEGSKISLGNGIKGTILFNNCEGEKKYLILLEDGRFTWRTNIEDLTFNTKSLSSIKLYFNIGDIVIIDGEFILEIEFFNKNKNIIIGKNIRSIFNKDCSEDYEGINFSIDSNDEIRLANVDEINKYLNEKI